MTSFVDAATTLKDVTVSNQIIKADSNMNLRSWPRAIPEQHMVWGLQELQ